MASREMLCPKDDKTLFLNIYGSSITRQGVWKTLKKYAESAGLKGITLETLRRSFALRYLGAGHDIRSLCDILGHSDVSITRAYVKS
jgi:integrase/recombinase XerD